MASFADNAPPAPQRRLIDSRAEYVAGLAQLLAAARRELRIFDPDLAELGLDSAQGAAALRGFLQSSVTHRLLVVVHDTDFASRRAPRLLALLASWPQAMQIRRSDGEAAKAEDRFIIADDCHLVRRPVANQGRGVFIFDDPAGCRSILDRFEEIWQLSLPGVSPNTTGL